MKQKFRKLTFVHVCKKMPAGMSHFESDFDAIVDGTYSQEYRGNNIDSYALYRIADGKITKKLSWYSEKHLTALKNQNRVHAEDMIEEYNLSRA